MPRSIWKGSPIATLLYQAAHLNKVSNSLSRVGNVSAPSPQPLQKLYRRNTLITKSLLLNPYSLDSLYVYNGYDFLLRTLSNDMLNLNISGLISTIELGVTHKAKVSKKARRMQQTRSNKKKLITPTTKRDSKAIMAKKRALSREKRTEPTS